MLASIQHQMEGTKFLRQFVEGKLISPVLLVGPEGVGRRSSILQAVQESFCIGTKQEGCLCNSCFVLLQGSHPDLIILRPEGDSDIGIDAIRELIAQTTSYPSKAKQRVFLIDGVDRLTVPAANAFLKTLEEPPLRSRIFLIAETYDEVLPTIRSRCGRINYNHLPEKFIASMLLQYESDPAKVLVYSRMSEGSVGRAIQYWGSGRIKLRDQVLKILQSALDRDLPSLFASVGDIEKDLVVALKLLEQVLHDVLMARVYPVGIINVDRTEDILSIGKRGSLKVWVNLASRVHGLESQYRTTKLNLPFQFKTILTETFG